MWGLPKFLEEIIIDTSAKIISAKTGKEALKLFDENPDISVVLMDIQLPDINGYEVTKKIKKKSPNIPVIAQTAYGMSDDKEKALNAGCDDYISKPIDIEKLMSIIELQLNKKI